MFAWRESRGQRAPPRLTATACACSLQVPPDCARFQESTWEKFSSGQSLPNPVDRRRPMLIYNNGRASGEALLHVSSGTRPAKSCEQGIAVDLLIARIFARADEE